MQTWLTTCANLVGKHMERDGIELSSLDQTSENDRDGDGPVPD